MDGEIERLTAVEGALKAIVGRTALMLDLYATGDRMAAGELVASVFRSHGGFLARAGTLRQGLRQAEDDRDRKQFEQAQDLKNLEYLIALMMVLMVCAITAYGHKLGKLLQRQYDELASFTAGLEQKVVERTRDLETANDSITNLNVELAKNILQLKEAQDEIIKRGRLAQLGQLTATVAHEIRTPLGSVLTATSVVERKIHDKGLGLEKPIERIVNGVKRCDHIISELLDFARSKSLLLKTVAVDEWVRNTVEEEAKALPPAVQVTCDLGLGALEAAFDADRMQRALVNLLANASEAMVGKEREGSSFASGNPKIAVTTRRNAGNIEIAVRDNGPGIAQENLKKALEPLFTTKSFGIGLGLPAVEKILEQHGGGLRIESKSGQGAVVTLWFPVLQHEKRPPPERRATCTSSSRRKPVTIDQSKRQEARSRQPGAAADAAVVCAEFTN